MNEREMLEFAAKAMGCEVIEVFDGGNLHVKGPGIHKVGWNSLTDDGDALRLAVQCSLEVSLVDDEPEHNGNYTRACVGYSTHGDSKIRYLFEDHRGDIFAATRLAITRAAAEIGKAIP